MFEEHTVFEKPEDENIKIWRYMDFTKFVYLLEKQSLFFTRSDKFEDPLEGTLNDFTIQQFREEYFRVVTGEEHIKEIAFQGILDSKKKFIEWTTINCWHLNNYESDAMWKLYLKSNEGIAIQSTFNRLSRSFDKTDMSVFIGKVRYEDYENYTIPINNMFFSFLTKSKSFEHEREIRAIHNVIPTKENAIDYNAQPFKFGVDIPVDLETLIENVYLAPNSPEWINELVKSVLKTYNLGNVNVIQSSIKRRY